MKTSAAVIRRFAIVGVCAFALAAPPATAAAAQSGEVRIPTEPGRPQTGPDLNLMAPAKDVLSGRAWLMAEGMDPGLRRRPGWNALTRMDWGAFGEAPASGGDARMQAPGGGSALVPFRDPAPAFSRNLLITRDFSQMPLQTEPHLAVNPNDPDHIVVGVIDYNFPSTTAYASLDGGETWEGPLQVPYLEEDRVSGGDPVIAFDRDGNVYYASISIGVEEFSFGPVASFAMVSSIAVAGSEDGGRTWPRTVSTARSGVDTRDLRLDPLGRLRGTLAMSFLDKPWMTVAPLPDEPERDAIYLTYTAFEVLHEILWIGDIPAFLPKAITTTIQLVRSDDGGRTWTDPVNASPTVNRLFGDAPEAPVDAPSVAGTNRTVQGSQPVVGSDGTVYVAWLDTTDDGSMKGRAEIHVASSDDAGRTFSEPTVAAVFKEIGFRPRNAFFRYWGAAFPQFAIGPADELYIVFTGRPDDRSRDDGDIFLLRSLDLGETWDEPRRLNDDDGDALQFFPAIDVAPDGTVHAMWADMRDDPSQIRYHIYYTQSEDQGGTWGFEIEDLGFSVGDTRVTDFPSNPNYGFPFGLFIGDYFGIAATDEDVYMVWADTRLGEFGPTNQKIAFARQRPMISPEVFISPPAGAGGQGISVQGFDFQPDMNVFIQLEDATIATARTDAEGRFTTSLFVPVTGEGAQTLSIFDQSGNAASTAYFTEFGFDNIRDSLEWIEIMGDTPRAEEFARELRDVSALLEAQSARRAAAGPWLATAALALIVLGGGASVLVRRRNHQPVGALSAPEAPDETATGAAGAEEAQDAEDAEGAKDDKGAEEANDAKGTEDGEDGPDGAEER